MNAALPGLDRSSVDALGGALLQFVVQGTVIAAVLAVVLRLLARATAQARYVAGCVAMVALLAAPIVTFCALRGSAATRVDARPERTTTAAPAASPIRGVVTGLHPTTGPAAGLDASSGRAIVVDSRGVLPARTAALSAALTAALSTAWTAMTSPWRPDVTARLTPWLVALWGLGVVLLTVRLVGAWWVVRRLGRASHQALDHWRVPLARLAGRMGVTRAVRLCRSDRVEVPTTWGWMRPIVLLPATAVSGLSADQIEAILAHELAHIRRHDYLVNLLQSVVETLLFYHPAVWWVSRSIREERELCCDDLAVRACGDAVSYARALCELEALRARMPRLAMAATGGSLVARIARLIGPPGRAVDARGGIAATLLAAVAVLTLTTIGLGLAPRRASSAAASATRRPATPVGNTQAMSADAAAAIAPRVAADHTCAVDVTGCEAPAVPDAPSVPDTPYAPDAQDASLPGANDAGEMDEAVAPAPDRACNETPEPDATPDEDVEALTPVPPTPQTPPAPQAVRQPAARLPAVDRVRPTRTSRTTRAPREVWPSTPTPTPRAGSLAPLAAGVRELAGRLRQLSGTDRTELERMGVTSDYVDRVSRQLSEPPSTDDLRRMFNSGVTPEYLRGMRRAGLDRLTSEQAVRLANHGVTPEFVSGLQGIDPNTLGPDELIRLASSGVTAEWFSAMRWLGYPKLSAEEAVRLAHAGVSPDEVGQLNALAGRPFTTSDLVRLRNQGVDAAYLARFRGRLRDLTTSDLVRLRQRGVDPEEVSAFEALGYSGLSAEDLIVLRETGVDPAYAAELFGAARVRFTVRDLARLRQAGVDGAFAAEAREAGWDRPSADDLIGWRRSGSVPRNEKP